MKILIEGKEIIFDDSSKIISIASSYGLEISEPGFDEKTSIPRENGIDKSIILPDNLMSRVKTTRYILKPFFRVYQDKKGRKKFIAVFD